VSGTAAFMECSRRANVSGRAVFMEGIIAGGKIPSDAAQILSRLWVVGVIPFFVGLGLS
jgi:hypothetical protein